MTDLITRSDDERLDDTYCANPEYITGHAMHLSGLAKTYRDSLAAALSALETERMRLVACGVAATQNTTTTIADRITSDNPYYSASYSDVCRAVDREMESRAALQERDAALEAKEKAEGALCSMKKAFDRFLGFFFTTPNSPPGPPLVPRSHNHKILDCPACARPDHADIQAALAALSSSSPCQHELAEKRLREALDNIAHTIAYLQKEADKNGAKLDGMAAVSLSNDPNFLKGIADEALRRRAAG